MASFGKVDQANDAPVFITNATTGESGQDEYGTRVFGIDKTEATVAGKGVAPGWVRITNGKGSLNTLTIVSGGTGYANADTIKIVNTAGANGAASLVTNGNGTITSVTITSAGGLYSSKSPSVTITTANGTGANLTAQVGGRAGRTTYESIVAMSDMTGSGLAFPS